MNKKELNRKNMELSIEVEDLGYKNLSLAQETTRLRQENARLKKIEENRKVAEQIAEILGDGWWAVVNSTVSYGGYGDRPTMTIDLTGDFAVLNGVLDFIMKNR